MSENTQRLAELSRVVLLSLTRVHDELSLALRLQDCRTGNEATFQFLKVSDLAFRGDRTELTELVLLVVEDISSDGWEGVRYRVKDYEEEFISFLCAEVREG
jgi:hypothetical protein